MVSFNSVVSHSVGDNYASWLSFFEESLKGKDPNKVLKVSSLEGVEKNIFYDKSFNIQTHSFPKEIHKAQFIDLEKYSDDLKKVDEELGVENYIFQIRDKHDLKRVNQNATLYILNPTDEIIAQSCHFKSYIDVNSLLFKDFELDIERVLEINPQANFVIDLSHIHNAGGSLIQEMTYGISLYKAILNAKIPNNKICFRVSCDSQLFLNIAKLKSLRFLIEKISSEFSLDNIPLIIGTNSLREQTLYDPWNNMLRNTTSSMAQIFGGANYVTCRPYDYLFAKMTIEKPSLLAYRYANQTLNILLSESHLSKVVDPSLGSHYVESLMQNIIKNAWASILNWDERNFLANIKSFAIEVKAIGKERLAQVRNRKKVITGVNDFASPTQTIENLYKKKWKPIELSFGYFPLRRPASEFEMLRAEQEFSESKVCVDIITYGDLANINARLNFIQNILDVAAIKYNIHSYEKDNSIKSTNEICILCAQDDSYQELIAQNYHYKKIYIAGRKSNLAEFPESYKEIYMGVNIFEVLKEILAKENDND